MITLILIIPIIGSILILLQSHFIPTISVAKQSIYAISGNGSEANLVSEEDAAKEGAAKKDNLKVVHIILHKIK